MADNVSSQVKGVITDPNGTPLVPSMGFLRVKNNEYLEEEERKRRASEQLLNKTTANMAFAQLIETRFQTARDAKTEVTNLMMDSLRRRKGEYSPQHLADIKELGGSDIFVKLTEIKCNAAEAWISDVALPVEGKPWGLKPSPKPELPPKVLEKVMFDTLKHFEQQGLEGSMEEVKDVASRLTDDVTRQIRDEAKRRANRMEQLIDDEFTEGGFLEALEKAIEDVVGYGTLIIKGPYIEMIQDMEWLEDDDFTPEITTIPTMKFKCVDPLDFFPSAGAKTIDDAVYLCERDSFTRSALLKMRGQKGYSTELINQVLSEHEHGVSLELRTDAEKAYLENRSSQTDHTNPDELFQGVWYTGLISGRYLMEFGIKGLDVQGEYEAVALKIGAHVIHATLNPDPLGKRNYSKAVYKAVKGSFWGQGVPRLMEDTQDACNAEARAIINNTAIGSGPQVVIHDIDNLAEDEDITAVFPWKVWQFNDSAKHGKPPITFEQPQIYTDKLIKVFEFFESIADKETGIPRHEQSLFEGGAMKMPATGLAMLMNSASRVLKKTIAGIDMYVFRPTITRAFVWNMLYVPDNSIKGDVDIETSGAMGVFVREQKDPVF